MEKKQGILIVNDRGIKDDFLLRFDLPEDITKVFLATDYQAAREVFNRNIDTIGLILVDASENRQEVKDFALYVRQQKYSNGVRMVGASGQERVPADYLLEDVVQRPFSQEKVNSLFSNPTD